MAKYDWSPWEVLGSVQDGSPCPSEGIACRMERRGGGRVNEPAADVVETRETFVIEVELPGVRLEDVELDILGRRITLRGVTRLEKDADGSVHHMVERSHGPFGRAFMLPRGIDPEGVSARLEAGVLTVTVPKKSACRSIVPENG